MVTVLCPFPQKKEPRRDECSDASEEEGTRQAFVFGQNLRDRVKVRAAGGPHAARLRAWCWARGGLQGGARGGAGAVGREAALPSSSGCSSSLLPRSHLGL